MKYLKLLTPVLAIVAAFLGAYLGGKSTVDLTEYNEAKEELRSISENFAFFMESSKVDTLYLQEINNTYKIENETVIKERIIRDSIIVGMDSTTILRAWSDTTTVLRGRYGLANTPQ